MGDAALIELARGGDQEAFRELVVRYADLAKRTAQVLMARPESAQDAVQEAWIDAWRGLGRFDLERPFRPWLLAIVANRCRMMARRKEPHMMNIAAIVSELAPAADEVAEEIERREADEALDAALASLGADQQRILELRYFAELELAEIALVLRLPLGTVKSRLHRALAALRLRMCSASRGDQSTPFSGVEGTEDSQ
jgi:RNA polymerase sigma-70 factor (ECF subfamily)